MKLIDKDAVVAEIESERKFYLDKEEYDFGWNNALDKILSFLDTIEVKEVDLEKELIEWHKKHFKKEGTFIGMSGFYLTNNSQIDIAKHFFELGMAVSKEEKEV